MQTTDLFSREATITNIRITCAIHNHAATMQRIMARWTLDPVQLVLALDLKALPAMSLTVLVCDGLEGRAMSLDSPRERDDPGSR